MRSLKFRVWDTKEDKYSKSAIMYFFDIISNKIKRYILEQYTGLKDKNGKEIYEGDIVKVRFKTFPDRVFVGYIGYDSSEAQYEVYYKDGLSMGSLCVASDDIEVIGNIHENSNLLKEELNGK